VHSFTTSVLFQCSLLLTVCVLSADMKRVLVTHLSLAQMSSRLLKEVTACCCVIIPPLLTVSDHELHACPVSSRACRASEAAMEMLFSLSVKHSLEGTSGCFAWSKDIQGSDVFQFL
jgi:hypothetical protein